MQVDAELIDKIRALAEDLRGDARIRAVAQSKLDGYKISHPHLFTWKQPPPHNQRNPRTEHSEDYARFRFMDLETWGLTVNGNRTCIVTRNGVAYRVVLFRYKKRPAWGWTRFNLTTDDGVPTFSQNSFTTMAEAQKNAWDSLMRW
jgi:hypothetical protein